MIVSYQHKFIFIKTRKTAGSSVESYLFPYLGKDDVCTGSPGDGTPKINIAIRDGHKNWKFVKQHFKHEFESYFKFAIERNPWDKYVSMYDWYQHLKPKKVKNGFDHFIRNIDKMQVVDTPLYLDQGKLVVDKLIKYEDLHNEFTKLPIPYDGELLTTFKKGGVRKNKDYRSMYTEETKQIVAEKSKFVIDYFGYEF